MKMLWIGGKIENLPRKMFSSKLKSKLHSLNMKLAKWERKGGKKNSKENGESEMKKSSVHLLL